MQFATPISIKVGYGVLGNTFAEPHVNEGVLTTPYQSMSLETRG
jgi:hypothetical protein